MYFYYALIFIFGHILIDISNDIISNLILNKPTNSIKKSANNIYKILNINKNETYIKIKHIKRKILYYISVSIYFIYLLNLSIKSSYMPYVGLVITLSILIGIYIKLNNKVDILLELSSSISSHISKSNIICSDSILPPISLGILYKVTNIEIELNNIMDNLKYILKFKCLIIFSITFTSIFILIQLVLLIL